MAILNGLYIHVVSESAEREVEMTSHSVENGLPTTDTVKAKALRISISGKIVDYGNKKASEVLSKIRTWQKSGNLLSYNGRNVASNMQIRSFESSHSNANSGGADFTMELQEVRIAKSAYVPKKESTKKKETAAKKNTLGLKVGDKVVFKGGPVYTASDSKKAAATRDRSTCKLTKISTASYSVHIYHLESTDGKKVYGWVDEKNVELAKSTSTDGKTNAGTQQTKSTSTAKQTVWHTVKSGDTVWALVNKKYRSLGTSVDWVIKNNSHAFSRKGDATTLQIGKSLKMGYK